MSKANEPAFPVDRADGEFGLTKREYFAAMAMQGELAGQFYEKPGVTSSGMGNLWPPSKAHMLACNSVIFADALIAELEKSEKDI